MFNPKKVVSLAVRFLVVAATLFVFADPSYSANTAKSSKATKKQITKKVKLQFDPQVYYKLSHKRRLEYLKVFMDLAVNLEKVSSQEKKSAMHDFYKELNEILFPRAEASYNGVCLNGGVFFEYTGKCPATIPASMQFANLDPYFDCPLERRCTASAGFDSSGKGFCYSGAGGASVECRQKSESANGRANLAALLANCSADRAKCDAFKAAAEADSANSEKYCDTADRIALSYCNAALAMIGRISSDTDGSLTPAPVSAMTDANSGCTEEAARAAARPGLSSMNSQLGFDRNADSYWMYLASLAQHACPKYRDMEEVLKVVGVCQAPEETTQTCTTETSRLGTCINDVFRTLGGANAFMAKVVELDSSLSSRSALSIKNSIASGNLTDLSLVARGLCPAQFDAITTCRLKNPSAPTGALNPVNIRDDLEKRSEKLAIQAIEAILQRRDLSGDALIPGKAAYNRSSLNGEMSGAFIKNFGMNAFQFRDMFCATDSTAFAEARKRAMDAGMKLINPMGARMARCAASTVTPNLAPSGATVDRSNYSQRDCAMRAAVKVNPEDISSSFFYEIETGLCRRAREVVNEPPRGSNVSVRCETNSLAGAAALTNQHYVRLDNILDPSGQPVYACLNDILKPGSEGDKKFDVFNAGCTAINTSGDAGQNHGAPDVGRQGYFMQVCKGRIETCH